MESDNPYEHLTESLVLKEEIPQSTFNTLVSKNLTTTSTHFVADTNDIDASGQARGKNVIQKVIKTPSLLLDAIEADSLRGIPVVDALASLFPPETVTSPSAEAALLATTAPNIEGSAVGDDELVRVARLDHADRMDVINLQGRLLQLSEGEGWDKSNGICSAAEHAYSTVFDEIIRQVVVCCPERGLLLAEIRDEMRETNRAFDLLFDTACQYAVRKAIERDLKRTMLQELHDLVIQTRIKENRVSELQAKYEGLKRRFEEQRAAETKTHEEDVGFLKKGNQQLTGEIKRLVMANK